MQGKGRASEACRDSMSEDGVSEHRLFWLGATHWRSMAVASLCRCVKWGFGERQAAFCGAWCLPTHHHLA